MSEPEPPVAEAPEAPLREPQGPSILEPREVPLGGMRAMQVRRTLPQRERSLIGAWCFVDHYGPEVTRMDVAPHPHTGLQTVSWLFTGTIEHRDSVGSHALINPGELNLMTAGAGISHSEVSASQPQGPEPQGPGAQAPGAGLLHGAQLWLALPDTHRNRPPSFERFVTTPIQVGPVIVRVFIGELEGIRSTVRVFTPLVGAQIDVPGGATARIRVDPSFEHGVLVDTGELRVEREPVAVSQLAYLDPGRDTIELAADTDSRVLLLGGEPFGEQIVMWWNFIGRDHDEIVAFRDAWQADVIAGGNPHGRFGTVEGGMTPIPAPELPNVRLKARDRPV